MMPGAIGGAGWGGGAFDPRSGMLYIKATNQPALYKIITPTRTDSLDADYAADLGAQSLRVTIPATRFARSARSRCPINKPPYGTLTAIDLNTGDTKWTVPLGDNPTLRNHPLLKILEFTNARRRRIAGADRHGGRVAVRDWRRRDALRARRGGRRGTLVGGARAERVRRIPMTYRTSAGKQFVVIANGGATGAKLTAFALP